MAVDVHPPEHPVRSFRDFVVQIITVTIGILIALSLENVVEHRRDRELLGHARAQFQTELQSNLSRIKETYEQEKAVSTWMDNATAWLQATQKHQAAKDPGEFPPFSFTYPPAAAWDSALAVGAIRLLTPRETQALSQIYNRQAIHATITTEMRERLQALLAFGDKWDDVTPQDMPEILREVRILQSYNGTMLGLEGQMLTKYQEALDAISAAEK